MKERIYWLLFLSSFCILKDVYPVNKIPRIFNIPELTDALIDPIVPETSIGVNPSNKERCLIPKKIELKEKIAVAIPVIHSLDEDLFCLARSVSILPSVPVIWGEAIALGLQSNNRNQIQPIIGTANIKIHCHALPESLSLRIING